MNISLDSLLLNIDSINRDIEITENEINEHFEMIKVLKQDMKEYKKELKKLHQMRMEISLEYAQMEGKE